MDEIKEKTEMQEKPAAAKPRRKWRRIRNITIAALVVALALFFGFKFYFPYGEGVKTGQLNFVVRKGVIFKTYEGKLIQTGFWTNQPGKIQSNEFNFSIADKAIADTLMHAGGQLVELRYVEYFGALPWRGHSKYVVNGIVNITPVGGADASLPPLEAVAPTGGMPLEGGALPQ